MKTGSFPVESKTGASSRDGARRAAGRATHRSVRPAGMTGTGCVYQASVVSTDDAPRPAPSQTAAEGENHLQQAWDDTVENINAFGRTVGSQMEDLGRTVTKHVSEVSKVVDGAIPSGQ